MRMLPAKAMVLICGMLAMLLCVAAPASAAPSLHGQMTVAAEGMPDMPCCPEKSTTIKACGQMCPAVAAVTFSFAYLSSFRTLHFRIAVQTRSGLTYDPLAPPPR